MKKVFVHGMEASTYEIFYEIQTTCTTSSGHQTLA
jgi:hypothetical protein